MTEYVDKNDIVVENDEKYFQDQNKSHTSMICTIFKRNSWKNDLNMLTRK